MDYPYGKAALWILLVALVSGVAVLASQHGRDADRPDLVFLTFAQEHADAYAPVIRNFEKTHHVRVRVEKIGLISLNERVRAALQAGVEVPDMVELGSELMGAVTRGPIDDVGFWDLTDKIHQTGLDKRLVTARFAAFSSRGHIFALPHDVHPVMLAYRRDIVEQLGIDVTKLTTWDEFARVGRAVTKDYDGDGVVDRFMTSFPDDQHDGVQILMQQRGVPLFDPMGDVAFDNETTVDTVWWYVHQTEGPGRINYSTKYGSDIARAIMDGLCLFYFCPDWQSKQFQLDIPRVSGKMALMPLPAWEPGGRRTSTWGGTGLAITKACKRKDLAWELANLLYYDKTQLGARFLASNILPPLKAAWSTPAYATPNPYYSNQPIGRLYADLAPSVFSDNPTPYTKRAQFKLRDAYLNTKFYYRDHGDAGLREFCRAQIHAAADDIRTIQAQNVFYAPAEGAK